MASERTEVFLARVVELGLEDCIPKMKTLGITTYALFAFGTDFNPQMSNTALLNDQLLVPLADGNAERIPKLRRLWWESWGVATDDMRRQVESAEASGPRKLGLVELNARRDSVAALVPGMSLEGELDVSDQLISDCVAMIDKDRLKYIGWEACTKRELEVIGMKRDEYWQKDDKTGFLKLAEAPMVGAADVSSDLRLDMALKRRGLALAMADVVSWEAHEKLRSDLVGSYMRAAPPGYLRPALQAIRRADETAFSLLSKMAKDGIKRQKGVRPLDELIDRVLAHRDYTVLLQPLPAPAGGVKRTADDAQPGGEKEQTSRNQRRKKNQAKRAADAQGKEKEKEHDGSAKGKGKAAAMPAVLRAPNTTSVDEEGAPICFKFNIDGSCTAAPPGARCPRGRHICVLKGCREPHGYVASHGK